jgi:hypothetical protein
VCLLLQCVFITAVPVTKLFACMWGGNNGGQVLRENTSLGLCGLVCPSRTSECVCVCVCMCVCVCVCERGGEGYVCVYYCRTYGPWHFFLLFFLK